MCRAVCQWFLYRVGLVRMSVCLSVCLQGKPTPAEVRSEKDVVSRQKGWQRWWCLEREIHALLQAVQMACQGSQAAALLVLRHSGGTVIPLQRSLGFEWFWASLAQRAGTVPRVTVRGAQQ